MNVTRILSFALLLAASRSTNLAKQESPNILFIFNDDQSFRTVSCYPGAYNYAHATLPLYDPLRVRGSVPFD